LFLTLPTRELTGQQVISSEGNGASRAFSSAGSAGSSPSQSDHASGLRTAGIRVGRENDLPVLLARRRRGSRLLPCSTRMTIRSLSMLPATSERIWLAMRDARPLILY